VFWANNETAAIEIISTTHQKKCDTLYID